MMIEIDDVITKEIPKAERKVTRTEVAYNYLRNAIIVHELAPGSPIVEQDISNRLDISRTPVREALKQLEAEGLIQSSPMRGYFVSEINIMDVNEIFDLRLAMELLALKTAINKITKEEIQETEEMLEELNQDCTADKFYAADRHLHDLITHNSCNRRLVHFLANINSQIERFRYIAALRPERLPHSREEHEDILKYIKAHDFEKAEAALTIHINHVKESVIHVYEKHRY
jgi:DNA-binding GntR family transcriptional regulator